MHVASKILSALLFLGAACLIVPAEDGTESSSESGEVSPCGASTGVVVNVIDGDTVDLADGRRVRYLLIDTPENYDPVECWGPEATAYNQELVEGQEVELAYDEVCTDRFGRTLAYVSVSGVEVNSRLIERGHACVLHIPPNGDERVTEFMNLQDIAQAGGLGMWGVCGDPCS